MWQPAVYLLVIIVLVFFCVRSLSKDAREEGVHEYARKRFLEESGGDYVLIQKAVEATTFEVGFDEDAPVERVIHHIRRLRLEA
jgi:hypothetical protein